MEPSLQADKGLLHHELPWVAHNLQRGRECPHQAPVCATEKGDPITSWWKLGNGTLYNGVMSNDGVDLGEQARLDPRSREARCSRFAL